MGLIFISTSGIAHDGSASSMSTFYSMIASEKVSLRWALLIRSLA